MLSSYRLAAIALGIILAGAPALAQETPQPTTQSEPEPAGEQQTGAPASDENTDTEQGDAEFLLPALQGIESAIRELIPEEDKVAAEADRRRDKADLEAQESMARWAFWMFIAAAASVVLTFVGLALLWRTLLHTRRAADYANDMVVEAKATTAAAQETLKADRAWIGFNRIEPTRVNDMHVDGVRFALGEVFVLAFRNYGRTPAVSASFRIDCAVVDLLPQLPRFAEPTWNDAEFSRVYSPSQEILADGIPFGYQDVNERLPDGKEFVVQCWFRYKTVTDAEWHNTVMVFGIKPAGIAIHDDGAVHPNWRMRHEFARVD